MATDYSKIITIEPNKRSGQPCIRGLRMTVKDVLEYLAGGMTPQEILDDFPDLTTEDIQACIAFAVDYEREFPTKSYLSERAQHGSREKFERVLAKVRNVAPEEYDKLPNSKGASQ